VFLQLIFALSGAAGTAPEASFVMSDNDGGCVRNFPWAARFSELLWGAGRAFGLPAPGHGALLSWLA
jgi:hypothetical protein